MDNRSSVQALVRLLEIFNLTEEPQIRAQTLDTIAESFGTDVVGIVCSGSVVAAVGVGSDATLLREIADGGLGPGHLADGPFGPAHTLCLPIENRSETFFVLARAGATFSGAESSVIRAMVRMMRLAVRTTSAFKEEQATRRELQCQVVANSALAEQLRDRHDSLMQRVMMIQRAVTGANHQDQTVKVIVEQASGLFGTDPIAVRLHDGEVIDQWTANVAADAVDRLAALPVEAGISGRAVKEDALVVDTCYRSLIDPTLENISAIAAPIHCRGRIVGSMTVLGGHDRRQHHDEEDQAALLILAGYVSVAITDATTTSRLQRSLSDAEWRASHDNLTGLLNRERIVERADEMIRAGHRPIALYIDFDGFKTVNDLYGHSAGDAALVALAARLSATIRSDGSVARLAGDEFLALLPPMQEATALDIARRVASALTAPLELNGRHLVLPPSIGIASIDAAGAEELLDAADLAMYQAKRSATERIAFFDDDLRQQRTRRTGIEQQLRLTDRAMNGFELHYQPILADPDAHICGYEALLRWDNAALGVVSPDEFIAVAEDTGNITRIDEWVLRNALKSIRTIDPNGQARVSVNLSPASFLLPALPDVVRAALHRAAASPRRLAIEITERVMLGNPDVVAANISHLRRLGVSIVLDDFGTGYSSLSYLRHLDVDGLKIDRSFVAGADHDERGVAILRSVIGLADSLGAEVIAEGVETNDELQLLRRLGCSRFQGYLFGRPVPVERVVPHAHQGSLSRTTLTAAG